MSESKRKAEFPGIINGMSLHVGCVHWEEMVQHMKREGMIETGQKTETKP